MNEERLSKYRDQINARLREIETEGLLTKADRSTVMLDQQSVGRLSRMDALQQQAMANATHGRRLQEKNRLTAALKRMTEDDFGYCADCGDEIIENRLDFDPSISRCISCSTG